MTLCHCGNPAGPHVHTPAGRLCWEHYLAWCELRGPEWTQRAELQREADDVVERMATHFLVMQGAKGGDE